MHEVDAVEQRQWQVGAAQAVVGAAVGQEAPLAVGGERDGHSGRHEVVAGEHRLHAILREQPRLLRMIAGADTPGENRPHPLCRKPGGLIGAGSSGHLADRRPAIGPADDRPFRNDDRIGHHVAHDENGRAASTPGCAVGHPDHCERQASPDRRASSTATCAATVTLFFTSAMFASRLLPPVSSLMRARR